MSSDLNTPFCPPAGPSRTAGVASRWPAALFTDPVPSDRPGGAVLHTPQGERWPVDSLRWHALPTEEEADVLARSVGTVLDVGCGPGRHVLALVAAGRTALGIDVSPVAVATARRRGAPALHVSVFGAVPDAGSWGTALLLDGNIGIGGDPRLLLSRLAGLLRPGGHVLVELDGPDVRSRRLMVRVEHAGRRTRWFPWARLAVPQIAGEAAASGFDVAAIWEGNGRWFADLRLAAIPSSGAESTARRYGSESPVLTPA